MIYRVYSDHGNDIRKQSAVDSWVRNGITNVPVADSELSRNHDGLPYLKDLLHIAARRCQNDSDIIIYTNSDIGLTKDNVSFPTVPFFSVRKQVSTVGRYSTEELHAINYEFSVNCDLIGFTKKWYNLNHHRIPDFLIGSPCWDICLVLLLKGKRLNNIIYHVEHQSDWKKDINNPKYQYNRELFFYYCRKNGIPFVLEDKILGNELFKYMSEHHGYTYLTRPTFISFYTPSHKKMYEELYLPSLLKTMGDGCFHYPYFFDQQLCKTAMYHTDGWRQTQIKKVETLIERVDKLFPNQTFVFCDVDLIHLKDYTEDIVSKLEKYEMVAQKAHGRQKVKSQKADFCSGFFAAKKTDRVMAFLKKILWDLQSMNGGENHGDQYYFNANSNMLSIYGLDADFFNPGLISGGLLVEADQFDYLVGQMCRNAKMVHANFILSPENKFNFLSKVYNEYTQGKWAISDNIKLEDGTYLLQHYKPKELNGIVILEDAIGLETHYHFLVEHLQSLYQISKFIKQGIPLVYPNRCQRNIKDKINSYMKFFKMPFTATEFEHTEVIKSNEIIKVNDRLRVGDINKEFIDFVRSFTKPTHLKGQKVFINRVGERSVGEKTRELILSKGYKEYFLEDMPILQQTELFSSATHIVAAHGGALTNMIFCNTDTKVIELNCGYNPRCYQLLAKELYNKAGININFYTLFQDEYYDSLELIYDKSLGSNTHLYIKNIFKGVNDQFHVLKDYKVFDSKDNKAKVGIEFALDKLEQLL